MGPSRGRRRLKKSGPVDNSEGQDVDPAGVTDNDNNQGGFILKTKEVTLLKTAYVDKESSETVKKTLKEPSEILSKRKAGQNSESIDSLRSIREGKPRGVQQTHQDSAVSRSSNGQTGERDDSDDDSEVLFKVLESTDDDKELSQEDMKSKNATNSPAVPKEIPRITINDEVIDEVTDNISTIDA